MAQQNARASSGNDSAASEAWGPINYPQLTCTNYTLWTMHMRVALQSAGAWAAVCFEEDRRAARHLPGRAGGHVGVTSWQGHNKDGMGANKSVNISHDRIREPKLQTLRKAFEALAMEDTFATRANKMVASTHWAMS
jgi:hypothetical protein